MVYKEDKKGKYFLPSKKNKNDHSNNFKCYLKKKKRGLLSIIKLR